jgi:hypothetical protein
MQVRKSRSRLFATGCVMALTMLVAEVHAQTPEFYVAGDIGKSRYRVSVVQDSLRTIGGSLDGNSTSGGIAFGWQAMPSLAFELGYTDFGDVDLKGRASFPCQPAPLCTPIVGNLTGTFNAKATHLSAIGSASITDAVAVFGRLGLARTDRSATVSISGIGGSGGETKTEAMFGVGAAYAFTKSIDGVFEWKWLADSKADAATLGIRVRF